MVVCPTLFLTTVWPKMGSLQDHDDGLIFMLTIDGTHTPIEEPRPFSTDWSSHKFGGSAGVNYEIGLLIHRAQLVWVHGPIAPGKYNDLSTFRLKLKTEMETQIPGKRAIGDKGYRGEPDLISTRNEFDPAEIAEFKDRALARHETFNQRVKLFKCFTTLWRHELSFNGESFRACCALTMYQIDSGGTSLFDPYP